MKKEIMEFIANCNEQTPLGDLKGLCENEEELNETLKICLSLTENHSASDDEIPQKWKESALQEFENVSKENVTCSLIQRKLGVGYNVAWRLKDWLAKIKED